VFVSLWGKSKVRANEMLDLIGGQEGCSKEENVQFRVLFAYKGRNLGYTNTPARHSLPIRACKRAQ